MKALLFALAAVTAAPSEASTPLTQGVSIPLPDTAGRIDHMAVDLVRRRLFVAELGNGTVDVIDLDRHQVIKRIQGLKEPQGIAYEPKSDLLAVASGGDGTLRFYSGRDYGVRGMVTLGDDADNVRIDPRNSHFVVGFGSGALAIVDGPSARTLCEIPLAGHPESFRLSNEKVFINVPDAAQIAVANLDTRKVTDVWKPPGLTANFPLFLNDAGQVAVVFRGQKQLALFDGVSGKLVSSVETCGDSDDLFFDASRMRFYVSCGSGSVDIFRVAGGNALREARIQTATGARTSLFVPELDRLFVAQRAGMLGSSAAILEFRPMPPR